MIFHFSRIWIFIFYVSKSQTTAFYFNKFPVIIHSIYHSHSFICHDWVFIIYCGWIWLFILRTSNVLLASWKQKIQTEKLFVGGSQRAGASGNTKYIAFHRKKKKKKKREDHWRINRNEQKIEKWKQIAESGNVRYLW